MTQPEQEDSKLLIRCPECKQRFKVEPELLDRIVECGICEHRFRIRDDVIVRMRKFYPGDAQRRGLKGFQRATHAPPVNAQLAAQQIYQPAPPSTAFEPLSPQRVIAGFGGVLAMVLMAMMLIFGASPGGMFDGVDLMRRLVLAGFVSLVGFVLLVYANPRTRMPAVALGTLMSIALLSLPFIFTQGSEPVEPGDAQAAGSDTGAPIDSPDLTPEQAVIRDFQERIGLRPLEQEVDRLRAMESPSRAYGLYLTGLQQSNRIAVRDFMFRVADPDPMSHIFPRLEDTYLFVLSGLDMSLEELASLASPLGEVRRILPEIGVVEIAVDNQIFMESNADKLLQRDDPAFYELNLRELRSIELRRVERAVSRLADAQPLAYRADITQRLHGLLSESGVTFHGPIARALAVWETDVDRAAASATQAAQDLRSRGQTAPPDLVALALKRPSAPLVDVVISQWRDNPSMWESQASALGPLVEEGMIREFESGGSARRQSAVRILSRTGGEASLAVLQPALNDADVELRLIIEQAIQLIRDRIAES